MNKPARRNYALVVAGGKGSRIKSEAPKQFIEIAGKPVLMHTLEQFHRYDKKLTIILVLPEEQASLWEEQVLQYDFKAPVTIKFGGKSRFQSVKNGLKAIEGDGLVAIHDGVRPLVSRDLIAASFNLAAIHGSAVAAVRLKESLREIDKDATRALDRSRYRLIQTPQTFRIALIKQAYEMEEDPSLTDDAGVLEKWGHKISLFEGSYSNIKITTEEDLRIAESFLSALEN